MNREGKKCVLYPRVSTEMQVDGYSLEGQKNGLKRFADREEMEIVGIYEDAGKSGKSIEGRPAFKKMLSDIKNGLEIDYILVYKLSRFGRNAADILNSLEFVQSYGINLICIEEGIDSSQTSGKLLISVLSAVAEIERENIIEQTMNGRREKARQGGWNGGFAPYGYYLKDNQLLIEETEAEAIRIIFDKFANSDIGLGGVAKYLNLQGIKKIPRQNGTLETWSSHFIRLILDNPVYCGKIAYGRRTREKVKGTKNEYKQVHAEDYILEDGQHEGIISEELWQKVHAKRMATGIKQPSKIGKDRSHLLTGILKCPLCGSSMYTNKHAWTNKDGTYKEVYYYICGRNKQERGHHCDYKASLRKTDIEPLVIEAVKELVSDKYFAKEIEKRIGVQTDTTAIDKELANYESKLKEVDLNKARLEREIDNLPVDTRFRERKIHDMTLRLDALYDTIVELEERIEDVKLRRSSIEMETITLDNIYKLMLNFGKLYDIISDEEKKSLITYLIKEIQIYPNGESEQLLKSIEFNFPIYRDGQEVRRLLWEKGNTVENVVLTDEWQKISMSWTAVMGSDATACAPALVLSGTGMHSFYIDTVEIKEVCSRADINDENYPSEWQNNANYYKSFKITDADAHSGSGSFVTTAKNAFMRLSYNDKAIRVSNGTVYLMSFWYKASSGTPEISFVTADAENVSSGAVKQASYKTAKSDKGKWKKAYVLFTAAPQGSNNTLWLSVSGADKLNIDDIKLTTSTEIVFNTMGGTMNGTEICTVLGTPGATASYSAPVKDGMYFYGWYQDAALTKKCGALTFPSDSDSITVYAKWVDSLPAAIVDFEDAPYGSDNSKWGSNTSTFFSPTVAEIITEDKHSDSKSLRLHFDPEKIKAVGSNITYNSPTLAFGMYDNVGNPMYIEKGKIYKVTLWYKAEKADCNLTVTAMATHNKNFWAYNLRTVYDDTAYTIKMSEAGGDWTKAEIYVNADEIITSDTQWGRLTGNHMFIWLRASSNKAFSVLFDDVIVEELPENIGVNIYQSNNGSNPVYTVGGVGTAVTLPKEPTRKNYTFGGWYTDKNCTQKYNGGSYKSNALLLYAKWNMNDTVVVDFEDEYYTSSLNGNQQTRASVATNFGHNSNSSMLVSKEGKLTSGDHWSGMIAVVGEVPFKVEKGATYMISYDYYVVRNKVAATASNTPHPYVRVANEKNIWLNYDDPNTGWYMGSTEKTGTWLTASFIYTADIPEGKDDTLYFTVNASQDFIGYFDNIRISKVDKGNGSILLLNPCGAESTGNMKLMYIGKNASAVTLPASTLVKKDYTFVGWYRDPALTVPFTDKSFSFIGEDTTLYAAWSKNTNLQDFEDYKSYGKTEALNYMDFDYEIYDLTSGNKDKSNVHSGNVSIHRIGNDHHFAAFQIFSAAASPSSRLVSGNVYKLSMWVKLESARHSTGAVKIASCSDAEYAWRISGEWLNVAAIKDLPAGEWKKIEYTFYANDGFLSIQTPGYVSMYIDDVTLEIKSNLKASDCSESLEIEEYVPRRLNADGTYDEEEITPIDLSCVKVSGAYAGTKDGNGNNTLWIVIAIVGGVVLAGAAATAAVIILKHRKTRR